MTTTVQTPVGNQLEAATSGRTEKATGVAGGALLVISMAIAVAIEPGSSVDAQQLLDHYDDDRMLIFASWMTMQLAGIALLWFLGSVRARLDEAGAARHAATAVLGGTVLVALGYVSRALAAAVPAFAMFSFEGAVLDPNTAKLLGIASYEILAGAGVASSVLLAAIAIGGHRTGLLGRGVARTGYVLAAIAVLSSAFAYFPVAAAGLWIIVVALRMSPRGGAST